MRRSAIFAAAMPFMVAPALATADNPEVLASGMVLPVGLATDAEGRIWVSEIGPPANGTNGVLSYFAPSTGWTKQVYVTDLPGAVNPNNGEPSGAHGISFSEDGNLLLSIGGPNFANPQLGGVSTYDISDAAVAAMRASPDACGRWCARQAPRGQPPLRMTRGLGGCRRRWYA